MVIEPLMCLQIESGPEKVSSDSLIIGEMLCADAGTRNHLEHIPQRQAPEEVSKVQCHGGVSCAKIDGAN